MRNYLHRFFLWTAAAVLLSFIAVSCGTRRKVVDLEKKTAMASLALAKESEVPELEYRMARRDTLVVKDDDGSEMLIMKAVRDEETGEMVANDVLDAAVVTARFRNVAERNGRVDLMFQVIVPKDMMDSEWQLRFNPDMYILEDSLRLDPVIITGNGYRRAQLKGYQQYERFIASIVTDSTQFINMWQLELFLKRNLPEIFAFKTDSTEVSNEMFFSYFGVSEEEAVEHYTNKVARYFNNRKKANRSKRFRRYVKAPIMSEGIRLDTVIRTLDGDFIYNYVQTIKTRPKLRKVDVVLSGSIYEQDKKIYTIPRTDPLTFYISSISAFTDIRERYLTRVVERRAEANTVCRIDFALGSSEVDAGLGRNGEEMDRIRRTISGIMDSEVFDLDSIRVTASSSPEGSESFNDRLSRRRSEAVGRFLSGWIEEYQDSLDVRSGFSVAEDGSVVRQQRVSVPFMSGCEAENWTLLDELVSRDTVMDRSQRDAYFGLRDIENPDVRESAMKLESFYPYMKEHLYPRLRTVRFDFHMHRKGMVKDTVHTTVIDSVYMQGVQALKDMDYESALRFLGSYNDYNTAIAFVALDRNRNALNILEKEERTAQVNYMLAVVYARLGKERDAVESYLRSCRQNPQYVHRGNLDPEISDLIRLYGLNKEDDDELLDY
jgi:hypothetical protein